MKLRERVEGRGRGEERAGVVLTYWFWLTAEEGDWFMVVACRIRRVTCKIEV